jgi:hypothetical protein
MRRTTLSEHFPAVASSLLINGTIVSHTSLVGDGRPNLHPAVWDFVNSLPTSGGFLPDGVRNPP